MIEIFKVYYYAEGEEVSLGYYTNMNKATQRAQEWPRLKPHIQPIEVNDD